METARVLVGKSIRKDLKKLSDKKVNSKKPKAKDSSLASLTRQIEKFWKIESLGIESVPTKEESLSYEEIEAIALIKRCTRYDEKKRRWFTGILFKQDPSCLGDNYLKTKRILESVERTVKQKNLLQAVNESYDEFLINSFAEKVPDEEKFKNKQAQVHYLPSHPVFTLQRESTKVRIVLNCSSSTQTGHSLNQITHTGPLLLPDLTQLLLQFRTGPISFIADVKKMFLQIHLDKKEDKDMFRYLWRQGNTDIEPMEYRMKTVVFGASHSVFTSIWVIKEHAKMFASKFPLGAELVDSSVYMDDFCCTTTDVQTGQQAISELIELLSLASMELHKFASNSNKLLANLNKEQIAPVEKIKVLGVNWDVKTDELHFKFSDLDQSELHACITKRQLLSQAASLYDPHGYIGPVTLKIKLILQKLWIEKIDWDEKIPLPLQTEWSQLREQLTLLNEIKIPRYLLTKNKQAIAFNLLTFCDASESSFCSIVYLYTTYSDNTISCTFLMAKTKITPIKLAQATGDPLTIVRKELLSLLLGSRLHAFVKTGLETKLALGSSYFFTDSSINYYRLKRGYKFYKQWTANRLEEILTTTKSDDWYHVPTQDNPADLGSRVSTVQNFLNSTCWLKGPQFVYALPPTDWKTISHINTSTEQTDKDDFEIKPVKKVFLIKLLDQNFFSKLVNQYSAWEKMLKLACFMFRFALKSHKKYKFQPITTSELDTAERLLIKFSQQLYLTAEYEQLLNKIPIKEKSGISQHSPILTEDGLIVSNTRLVLSATLSQDEKYPIILPKNNFFTEKFVLHLHHRYHHLGLNHMLALVRSKYLLLGGRREMKRILAKCPNFRCVKTYSIQQQMAVLPEERLSADQAFEFISLDYAGPIYYKQFKDDGQSIVMKKCYIALFCCFVTRCVHLELILDASTEEFLNALRLLIARRGRPARIHSDNQTAFVKADKELKKLLGAINWSKVDSFAAKNKIDWSFTVPYTPHMNGSSEAMVKQAKRYLRIIVGQASLTLRQLQVLLGEIEQTLNSRPLQPVTDFVPITPSELLVGKKLLDLPSPAKFQNLHYKDVWMKRKRLLSAFWQRWSREYLFTLGVRKKWKFPTSEQLLDRFVLINDKNLSKNDYNIGRIIAVVPSKSDNLPRIVQIQTKTGAKIFRSINNLSFFENDVLT